MNIPRMPAELSFYGPYFDAARARLDEVAWQTAWSEGRAMGMEEAIEYALSDEEHLPTKLSHASRAWAGPGPAPRRQTRPSS